MPQADDPRPTPAATPPSAATIAEAMGGWLGVVESSVPAIAFVIAFSVLKVDATPAAIVALGMGGVMTAARLLRGQTLQYAVAGLAGVGLSAFIVSRTGDAEDFFLPGLLMNLAYGGAYLVSIAIRWPLLGVFLSTITQSGSSWRDDPEQLRLYTRASWVWVALFAFRLAVQVPIYIAEDATALGIARTAMGVPLFAVGVWVSWLILRPILGAPRPAADHA